MTNHWRDIRNADLILINGAKVNGSIESARGSVQVGPNGQVNGSITAGTTITNQGTVTGTMTPNQPSSLIVANAVPDCGAFTVNLPITGGRYTYVNGDLSVSGAQNITLGNGTYCFHSLTLSGASVLQVAGPVSINVTGVINAGGGSLVNTTKIPSNLQIASSFTGADGVTIAGNTSGYLTVYAPGTSVAITGGSHLFGAILGKTLTISGNSQIHYDTQLPQIWSGFGF